MSRAGFVVVATLIVLIAMAFGNGPSMLRALETGLARGLGYQIAHEIVRGEQ